MLTRIISPILILSPRKLVPIFFILSGLVSSCGTVPLSTQSVGKVEPPQTAVADVFTPTPQVLESTPVQAGVNNTAELFSSDRLGICFSYPQGYTLNPDSDTVQITAPILPNTDVFGLFWLEISDAYDRTAGKIADEEVTQQGVPPENIGRWTVTLDGEQTVVLDGMSGQDLQRRLYVVRGQTLYVLAFMPTRSENKAARDQMEALYAAVTSSWAWFPCSAVE